jgi:predicted nucleic acid-binding protein
MKVLLDTSVLIAAMIPDHSSHESSHHWLSRAKHRAFTFVVSGHSLAKTFAVLTRLPADPPITPQVAWNLIEENIVSYAEIQTLITDDYLNVVEDLVRYDLSGGIIYDAIIAKAAQLAKVDRLLTLNVDHFRRVWPEEAGRIVSPETAASP